MRNEIKIRENGKRRVLQFCEGESLTRQSMQKECDINNILAKYKRTGLLSHITSKMPFYGDVTEIGDLSTAIDVVRQAQENFLSLPAKIRLEFNNDPVKLVSFLQDNANYDRAAELGLVPRRTKIESDDEKAKKSPPSGGQ